MTLYQHQLDGAQWLLKNPKGYLAHRPGLGKTRTLIQGAYLAGVERPLIVCPAIVRSHWQREITEMGGWNGLPAHIKSYDEIMRGGNALMVKLLRDEKVDALILDEAHYLKHASASRTTQILGRAGYARYLDIVWPASGTPLPRNPAEIYTILASLFPAVLVARGIRTYDQFVDRYCVVRTTFARGQMREKIVGNKQETLAELTAMLAEIMDVKTLDDVGLDVPRIQWQITRLNGGDPYFGPSDENLIAIPLGRGDTLEEIAADPHVARMRRRLGELKVGPVSEMLTSQLAASEEKVAVFAHHRSVLAGLRAQLMPFGVAYIDGDTGPVARDAERERFINDPKCRVFLGQNQACSTGMDGLQAVTNRAILVEPAWTADVNDQLGHRVARMGSTFGRAIVQMIALAGTLDEAIVAQNKRETEMVAEAMASKGMQ